MNLLLDTNILINLVRERDYNLLNELNPRRQKVFVSVISLGEIRSFALRNNWTSKKLNALNLILKDFLIMEVTESLVEIYAEIDAFSQRKNPAYIDYPFATPRNMGKNDLWIAATAALLGLKLITEDADFNHLHQIFVEVQHIQPKKH